MTWDVAGGLARSLERQDAVGERALTHRRRNTTTPVRLVGPLRDPRGRCGHPPRRCVGVSCKRDKERLGLAERANSCGQG